MTNPHNSTPTLIEHDVIMVSDGEGDRVDTPPTGQEEKTDSHSPIGRSCQPPLVTPHLGAIGEAVEVLPGESMMTPPTSSNVTGEVVINNIADDAVITLDSDEDMSNGDPPARSSVKVETSNAEGEVMQVRAHNISTSPPDVEVVEAEESTGDEETADEKESTDGELDHRPDRTCSHCNHVFIKPYYLRAHLKAREKNGTCRDLQGKGHFCPHCSKFFTRSTGLTNHLTARAARGDCSNVKRGRTPDTTITCAKCHESVGSLEYLMEHAREKHDLDAQTGEMTFKAMTEFSDWFDVVTLEGQFQWVKPSGSKKTSKTTLYLCSRSGTYVDQGKEKRNRLKKSTRKLDAHCTSYCRVVQHSPTNITATYCLQHIGHEFDLCHLPQNKTMRVRMQELHKQGMSLDQILATCRKEFPHSMVKMTDVFNTIYRGRGDDLQSVMEMVAESLDAGSTDFFVTPEERESGVYTQIGIQTEEMKKKYVELIGENVVMDSTACVSRYDHVLVALVCVDKMNRGHVVAFLIVKGESEEAMKDLMFELRKRCGQAKPRLFASDAAPALFNVWKLVNGFEEWQCRLVCQWHALRALSKAVHGVGTDGKKKVAPVDPAHDGEALRKEVMALLVQMSKTKDQSDCLIAEELLLQYLGEGSVEFRRYLQGRYLNKKEQWTRAFRDCGDRYVSMVTSMHIEATFRVIKHVYLKGIANRRLDVLIWNLLRFAADRAQLTATTDVRPAYVKLENAISKKHRVNAKPYFEDQTMIEQVSETHWKIKSATEKTSYMKYDVHLTNTGSCMCHTSPCCQQLLSKAAIGDRLQGVRDKDLPRCGLCDCRYQCSCEDWRFRSRSCKHMHAVHSIFYVIPAAMGDIPTVWLTGIATDLVNDPANNDSVPDSRTDQREQPTEPIEPVVVDDVAGPSSSASSSRFDRSNTLLMNMSAMVTKRCKRLMDHELTDDQLARIEAAMDRDDDMFTEIGVELGLPSWNINPEMPSRKQKAVRHSHNMGRIELKDRKTKKPRKV